MAGDIYNITVQVIQGPERKCIRREAREWAETLYTRRDIPMPVGMEWAANLRMDEFISVMSNWYIYN